VFLSDKVAAREHRWLDRTSRVRRAKRLRECADRRERARKR